MSRPPFDSLNLARHVGDDPGAVEENHRRFAAAVGFEVGALVEVSQVHGAALCRVGSGGPTAFRDTEADALVAPLAGTVVGVRTADCVAVLLGDLNTRAVAAVHAGWRGVVARVLGVAAEALVDCGPSPARLVAAVGPHIRVSAFEVGEEVAARIDAAAHGRVVVHRGWPRPHVDLLAAVRAQLEHAGLLPAHIDDVGGCSYGDAGRFFSYRREGSRSGRHLAAIVAG